MNHTAVPISFEGKLPDEHVYYVFDKHWIADIKEIIHIITLFLLPLGLVVAFWWIFYEYEYMTFMIYFFSLYFACVPLYIFMEWVNDAFDILILTDQRIVNIVQEGFLSRKIIVAEIHQIQVATYKQQGFLDQIFGMGTVTITTAGRGDLIISGLPKPDRVTDLVLDFAAQYKAEKKK